MPMMTSLFDRYLQESDAFSGKGKSVELGKAHKFLKYILVFCNVVFLIFACVLMGVGSYAYNHGVGPISGKSTLPLGVVVLGVFIMFLSFLGCLSAMKESRIFLGFYFFFLMLMTFLLFVVGIAVYAKKSDAQTYIKQAWMEAPDGDRNSIQHTSHCCGLDSFNDSLAGSNCPWPINADNYPSGTVACSSKLAADFEASFSTVGTAGITMALLMVFFLAFVCCLMRGIRAKALKADLDQLHTGDDSAAPSSIPEEPTSGV